MSLYLLTVKVEHILDGVDRQNLPKKVASLVNFPNESYCNIQIACGPKFSPQVGDTVSIAIYREEDKP